MSAVSMTLKSMLNVRFGFFFRVCINRADNVCVFDKWLCVRDFVAIVNMVFIEFLIDFIASNAYRFCKHIDNEPNRNSAKHWPTSGNFS